MNLTKEQIIAAQMELRIRGFDPGVPDGIIGMHSRTAIKMFQKSKGLQIDGDLGPYTLAALFDQPKPPKATELSVAITNPIKGIYSVALIKKVCSLARLDVSTEFEKQADEIANAGIVTPMRAAHFLAQFATETGGLRILEENLNYSAERLHAVWPNRFPSITAAAPYAHNPEKLANFVYGGRLGNVQPGDGWRYRGGGGFQTTGRFNYTEAGHAADPEYMRTPEGALRTALTFWVDNKCAAIADTNNVVALRKRINGGTNGLEDARLYTERAIRVFKAA